jgi:hypothetical protein
MSMSGAMGDHVGNTKGWFHGKTVKFHYTKDYFCKEPPHSKAGSHCELGADFKKTPSHDFDPLYVIVPIGFTPSESTLQCPTAGKCIDHPSRIDLSRVFGAGTGKSLLPPHSHIVTTAAGHKSEWWNVEVVGVSSQHAWSRIVHAKNLKTIEQMRRADNPNVTADIGTNLFLFFSVLRSS